jgi:hypothetical protein
MWPAIGSFSMLLVCSYWVFLYRGADALDACLFSTLILSGLVTLFHSDKVLWAVSMIFGQLLLVPFFLLGVKGLHLDSVIGRDACESLGCLFIAALINLTTRRHLLLSLLGYVGLDAVLAWATVRNDPGLASRAQAFVLLWSLGAVLLLIPVIVGGLRRARPAPRELTEDP